MNIEQLRQLCLSFPGATEQIQWQDDLLFKVGGKMFAIAPLVPAPVWLTFKADAEEFVELTERAGILPAPYLARAKWVAIESANVLSQAELSALVRKSYDLVVEKLPRRVRESLAKSKTTRPKISPSRRKSRKRRTSSGTKRGR